jgi:hypothetical protein
MSALEETLFDDELARILRGATNAQARERLVEAVALLIAGDVDLEHEYPLPLPEPSGTVWERFTSTVAMLSQAVQDARGACRDNRRILEVEMARTAPLAGLH